jgi:hypothetical protein
VLADGSRPRVVDPYGTLAASGSPRLPPDMPSQRFDRFHLFSPYSWSS